MQLVKSQVLGVLVVFHTPTQGDRTQFPETTSTLIFSNNFNNFDRQT